MKDALLLGALLALYLVGTGTEPRPETDTIRGLSSWYCGNGSPCTRGYGPSDLVAAIDSTTGIAKGEWVRVTSGGRSVTVRIVDVCLCKGARVIDLTSGAFKFLSPDQTDEGRAAFLGRGVIPVTLSRGGPSIPLPETSTE